MSQKCLEIVRETMTIYISHFVMKSANMKSSTRLAKGRSGEEWYLLLSVAWWIEGQSSRKVSGIGFCRRVPISLLLGFLSQFSSLILILEIGFWLFIWVSACLLLLKLHFQDLGTVAFRPSFIALEQKKIVINIFLMCSPNRNQ